MLKWKQNKDGSTALLIKGARRVGKSTIAEEFAKREYESYIVVDFADAPAALWEAVENISNRDDFFLRLQFIYGKRLYERKSVIIFDEIQKCPKVREAIKYLVKDHRYDYIEIGSLLSIKKNTTGIVIPSEETRLTMYPMDYEEFRWALGDEVTVPLLRDALAGRHTFGDAVARKLMRDFRLYMLVGGMPQAINTYLDTNNLMEVDQKKREIIELYLDDFLKIDPSGKISKLFFAIPAQLTGNASRFMPTGVLGRYEDNMNEILRDLEDSMTVNFAHHANQPAVGLPLHTDYGQYKLFMGDTGLFITVAFWDKNATDNEIYQKLLSDKLSADLGYVYENVVAQMLVASGNKLFYHTWSSGYKTHKSLDLFCQKFSEHVSDRFLVYTKDIKKDGMTLLLPVFMASVL